jgi:hypothetical protein
MKKFVIGVAGIFIGFGAGLLCFAMISHTPVSEFTGGHGRVTSGGIPVAGAYVTVSDVGGKLSARTDKDGRFNIKVDSRRRFYLSMSNPLKHSVTLTIEKDGFQLMRWQFEKRVLGENYRDFGVIDVASR